MFPKPTLKVQVEASTYRSTSLPLSRTLSCSLSCPVVYTPPTPLWLSPSDTTALARYHSLPHSPPPFPLSPGLVAAALALPPFLPQSSCRLSLSPSPASAALSLPHQHLPLSLCSPSLLTTLPPFDVTTLDLSLLLPLSRFPTHTTCSVLLTLVIGIEASSLLFAMLTFLKPMLRLLAKASTRCSLSPPISRIVSHSLPQVRSYTYRPHFSGSSLRSDSFSRLSLSDHSYSPVGLWLVALPPDISLSLYHLLSSRHLSLPYLLHSLLFMLILAVNPLSRPICPPPLISSPIV